jgi:hypothetical protein
MGRCEGATAEKAVPFLSNAHRSYSLFCFAALNPFCGADLSRSGPFTHEKMGGDSITFLQPQAQARDGFERSETHPPMTRYREKNYIGLVYEMPSPPSGHGTFARRRLK